MMKHNILILDDDPERFSLFSRLIGNEFDTTHTAENFLALARSGEIIAELLLLDHDLGSALDGSGMVKVLQEENIPLPTVKRAVIHSNNIHGASRMADKLIQAYPDMIVKICPASSLDTLWREDFERKSSELRKYLLSIE